jgi:hypothetical protein
MFAMALVPIKIMALDQGVTSKEQAYVPLMLVSLSMQRIVGLRSARLYKIKVIRMPSPPPHFLIVLK